MGNPLFDIRIGTCVQVRQADPANYIRQILPHGFESFQLIFGRSATDIDIAGLAQRMNDTLRGSEATISALGVYGNPLESGEEDRDTLRSWELLIEHAHLFGAGIVAGFTGRLRGKSIDASMPRFREVFTPLAEQAAARGLRLAFENCAMGGDWHSGDWNLAHNPAAWALLFETVPADNLGLEWEPCHQMLSLIDPLPQLREWAPRIFHLHGKCCTIKWDIIRRDGIHGPKPFAFHRTPGFGDCNWTDIISELRMAGFAGAIDIEGWHDPVYCGALEMTAQVHSLAYLKTCRGGSAFVSNPA